METRASCDLVDMRHDIWDCVVDDLLAFYCFGTCSLFLGRLIHLAWRLACIWMIDERGFLLPFFFPPFPRLFLSTLLHMWSYTLISWLAACMGFWTGFWVFDDSVLGTGKCSQEFRLRRIWKTIYGRINDLGGL